MSRLSRIAALSAVFLAVSVAVARCAFAVTIADVRIEYPAEPAGDLRDTIGVRPGEEYSERRIRESIERLYLKGMFRDIDVYREDTPAGAILTYRLTPRPWVFDIEVEGNDELGTSRITGTMSIKERDFMDEKLVRKSESRILKLYRDEGFGSASVKITSRSVSPVRAVLMVDIREGTPTLADGIHFVGDTILDEDRLADELEFENGDRLRKEDIETSLDNLTELYVEEGYVNVSIKMTAPQLEEEYEEVVFSITPGPRLIVEFEGNDAFSESDLKEELTFWNDRDSSPDNISENLDLLTAYYVENGFYLSTITSRTEKSGADNTVHVMYIITEGPRAGLEEVVFKGTISVDEDDLLDVMELKESGLFGSTYVTDEKLKKDAERLKALYATMGYLDASVVPREVEFIDNGRGARIAFDITEGPMTVVHGVSVEGDPAIPPGDIIAAGRFTAGMPYNPQLERPSINEILNMYSQRGYIHAQVELVKKFSDEKLHVDLAYKVASGDQVHIGNIIITGNEDTRDSLIYHELLVKPGDVYDYERILRSQRAIYRLGFFSKARIEPVEPRKEETVKDLLVTLKERDAGAVEVGVGYGDFDRYRGFLEVSYSNVFGLGHRISARGEMSTKEVKTVLGYKWPWFMDYSLDFRANLVYLDAEKVNYDIDDFIMSAGFDKKFGDHITASIEYKYEKLDLNALPGAALSPEDRKKSNLASISPSIVLDYRDDPFNPKSGSIHGITFKLASEFLGSTSEFYKITGQTSWFFEVYKGIVFAASFRGGYEGLFRRDIRPPINERFFLGGASSLRGYNLDTVAPLGPDGTPAGGDAMFLMNYELRFPLPYDFGFVTFLDAGSVWLIDGDDRVTEGSNGLKYTIGAGIRYDTPVGPLRLDYGYRMNPLPDDKGGEVHFTLGHAF